jgi:hypothetical protein
MALLRLVLRVAGAVLLLAIAYVHGDLWLDGYRSLSVIGPLFIVQTVAAAVLGIAVLLSPRRWLALVALAGAALAAGTAAGLLLSTKVELFGFRESLQAPHAVLSLWLEGAATVVLLGLAWLATQGRDAPRTRASARPRVRSPH